MLLAENPSVLQDIKNSRSDYSCHNNECGYKWKLCNPFCNPDHPQNNEQNGSQCVVRQPELWSRTSGVGRIDKFERYRRTQMFNRYSQPTAESVFVEPVFGPSATVADTSLILDVLQSMLSSDGFDCIQGVAVGVFPLDQAWVWLMRWVHRD